MGNGPESGTCVWLVSMQDNPRAEFDEATFKRPWRWLKALADWNPADGLPAEAGGTEAIIVFSRKYEEKEALGLCRRIRENPALETIPLLVAINMYQMPLGNNVKRMANADFVFTPLQEEELNKRLAVMGGERSVVVDAGSS